MSNLSPWLARPGVTQGRIAPAGWTPPDGSFVFCLGSDVAGVTATFIAGDYIQTSQSGTLGGVKFVRFAARIRPPSSVPAGAGWRFDLMIDGVAKASKVFTTGHARDLIDMAANVGDLGGGAHAIAFRLTLTGIPAAEYEVELPGVYVDAVQLDSTTADRPELSNRDAEPNETQVPGGSPIAFSLFDPGGSGVDTSTIAVTVNGLAAIVGGVAQTGFAGSSVTVPNFDNVAVSVVPGASFASLSVVTVRVQASLFGGISSLDETFSFTIADTTAPEVVAAFAPDHVTIRVSFDEPLFQGDGTTLADALNPANYEVALLDGAPAITPTITAVVAASSQEVLLTCDIEMTRGATYAVTVTNVTDLFANPVVAPNNVASFTGYRCDSPPSRNFTIYNFWSSLDRQGDDTLDLKRISEIWQEIVDVFLCLIDRFLDIIDPDTTSAGWLDLILADLGNPFGFDLTDIEKQRLISVLVPIYKSKGTDAGIIDAVRFFLGLEVTIDAPWILPSTAMLGVGTLGGTGIGEGPGTLVLSSSDPFDVYAFRIISAVTLTDLEVDRVTTIARYMKRSGVRFTIVQPTTPVPMLSGLILGVSRLNLDWRLN